MKTKEEILEELDSGEVLMSTMDNYLEFLHDDTFEDGWNACMTWILDHKNND